MKSTLIKPMRVQRLREKGFKLQNASRSGLPVKYVGRPTKWGNPFKLKGDTIYIDASYRRKILSRWVFYQVGDIDDVIRLYRLLWIFNHVDPDLQHWHDHFMSLDLMELKGKDLACFCPLSSPCHADFLIELVEAFCAEQNK